MAAKNAQVPYHQSPPYHPPEGVPPPGFQQPPPPYGPPLGSSHPSSVVIINQPIVQPALSENRMPHPQQPPPNCPPGLEYLSAIDQLLVHQKVELLEAFTGFETNNKYRIKNSLGQDVYYAKEDNDCCTRNCCGPIRPTDIKILDNFRNEVIHLNRPLRCQSCCFPCCLQVMEVSAPPGNLIGTVEQEWSIFFPTFAVKNANRETVLRIEGPFLTCSCCCNDVKFRITTADGSADVGTITKQWSGLAREAFTDADHFGITFPMDLDVNMKAVMLGGCFLIDMMFFEQTGDKN